MTRRHMLLGAALVAAATLVVVLGVALIRHPQHTRTAAVPPTDAQARALLDAKITQAQRLDVTAYCADASSPEMCADDWAHAGGNPAVPTDTPRVVGSRVDDGYRALRVCGNDGLGRNYSTDFLVQMHNGTAQAVFPIYWNDRRWSGHYIEGEEPGQAGADTQTPPNC